ncbi:transcription modulator under heat shock [Klebsiella phage ValerieMcCarty01]|nr:transcription modulator under heat shock [Klebsiella phage ValerieMcCarty01]
MPGSPINILGALHLKGYTNAYHETDLFEYANDKIVNGKSIVIDNEDAFIVFTQLVWSFMQADFARFTPSDLLQKAADAYNNSNSQYRRMEWFM